MPEERRDDLLEVPLDGGSEGKVGGVVRSYVQEHEISGREVRARKLFSQNVTKPSAGNGYVRQLNTAAALSGVLGGLDSQPLLVTSAHTHSGAVAEDQIVQGLLPGAEGPWLRGSAHGRAFFLPDGAATGQRKQKNHQESYVHIETTAAGARRMT